MSVTVNLAPPPLPLVPPLLGVGECPCGDGLGDLAPLALRVKALGSSIAWRRDDPLALVGPGSGGGELGLGGAGAAEGGGGGGAGGAPLGAGDAWPAERIAAWAASDAELLVDAGGGGGGGGCARGAGEGLGRGGAAAGGGGGGAGGAAGAAEGGGGGGAEGVEADDVGGGGGGAGGAGAEGAVDSPDGLRDVGRGGGFFPIGGGGGFFPVGGLGASLAGPGGIGGPLPGIAGAAPEGGFGAERFDSPGSERYEDSSVLPVSTPPRLFFSLGIPPAKSPPSCGAPESIPVFVWPWSLLLLALFPGTGGARPPGGFGAPPIPGTGGAPPTGGPEDEDDELPTWGADRSFVTAFFKAFPL